MVSIGILLRMLLCEKLAVSATDTVSFLAFNKAATSWMISRKGSGGKEAMMADSQSGFKNTSQTMRGKADASVLSQKFCRVLSPTVTNRRLKETRKTLPRGKTFELLT